MSIAAVALSINRPTMSPGPLLLWVTDKRTDYDRLYKKTMMASTST
jgi:hypothetical protein